MSAFLVLGLIPGTPIQITFLLWIVGVVAVVLGGSLWIGHKAHLFRNWLVMTMVVVVTRSQPAQFI